MYAPTLIDLAGHRRIADRVEAGAAVAGGDEHLDVVLLDQPVVEHGAGVVAVIERGQAADRHVDHVDVALLGGVDHALDQGDGRAAGDEQTDADRDDLGAGRRAAHGAAEQAVARGDAGNVRAVRAGDDADVDDLVLAIGLHDERHALGDGGGGVVHAEVVDVIATL